MKTVVHITARHSAFDDRIFYKEARSLSTRYRTIVLAKSQDGMLRDMGGRVRQPGVHDGVEVAPFVPRTRFGGLVGKAFSRMRSMAGLPPRVDVPAIMSAIDGLGVAPDVIHLHEPELGKAIGALRGRFSCKVIFDCHEYHYIYGITTENRSRSLLRRTGRRLDGFRSLLAKCNGVISVSRTMMAMNWFLAPKAVHAVVRNSTLIDQDGCRERAAKIQLVHEGNLTFDRGFKLMLDLFRDEWFVRNVTLRIVGRLRTREQEFLDEQLRLDPALADAVEITGWVPYEALADHLRGDIGIIFMEGHPNNYLGMPNKLFNYVGAGMPVITVPLLEAGGIVEDFGIGEVAERNRDSIARAIRKIHSAYPEYRARVIASRAKMSWRHDEGVLFEAYEKVQGVREDGDAR